MTATLRIERFDEEIEVLIEARVSRVGRDSLDVADLEAYLPSGHVIELSGKEEDQAVEAILDAWSLR